MRILVAGLGAIGQRHARNLRAICGPELELLAFRRRGLTHVVTETLQRDDSRNVETELGFRVFHDLDEALAARPHAVFVCTPSSAHVNIARRAADAGCHLFIEKPVSHTLDGIEDLRTVVAARGLVALVAAQWRFHPCVRLLRDAVKTGAAGPIEAVEIDYAEYLPDWHPYEDYRTSYAARADLGGGVVLTQIHDYDLAWWLFGPPRTVTATGGHLSGLEIDVEDTVDACLRGGDAPVRVRQTFASKPPRRTITVRGARGSIVVDLLGATLTADPGVMASNSFEGYRRNEMFMDEARHFLACLDGTAAPAIPLDDGIEVLRVALAVKRAMRSRQPVELK